MTALELSVGAITVVFGSTGSGKTDVVRRRWLEVGKNAAYQPQRTHLFRGLLGANLGLGLTAEQCGLAGHYARRLGLGTVLAEPESVATEDVRGRLTLARTLARPEQLVILDEPLAPVETGWRSEVIALVREALSPRTGLVATGDPDLALQLADRLAIVEAGRVVQHGDVGDVVRSDRWPDG